MSHPADREFRGTVEKEAGPMDQSSASNLSIASVVMGLLGFTLLPLLGSIFAIALGHTALSRIGRSRDPLEGRGLPRAGLALGYLGLVLGILGVVAIELYLLRDFPRAETIETRKVRILAPPPSKARAAEVPDSAGVKMANQMGRDDLRLIEGTGVDAKLGEIIGFYNAGKAASDPELALLTTAKLFYVKDGRTTEFDLKDVTGLKDDQAFEKAYRQAFDDFHNPRVDFDPTTYHVEVKSARGPRMHVEIRPERDGALFFDALHGAALSAGAKLDPSGGR